MKEEDSELSEDVAENTQVIKCMVYFVTMYYLESCPCCIIKRLKMKMMIVVFWVGQDFLIYCIQTGGASYTFSSV